MDGPYEAHPIELESFRIIGEARDWSGWGEAERPLVQRLVHAAGDVGIADDVLISEGAVAAGVRALLDGATIVTDVSMVRSGLKRDLLKRLGVSAYCGVHEGEVRELAREFRLTRSAAGIREAWRRFGDHVILALGDAPTAVEEALRLIAEHEWRPALVIAFPVGFVGTERSKRALWDCARVARVTNRGTRGGSPWAAAAANALLIAATNARASGG